MLTLKYDHKRIRLEVNELTSGLLGKYADTYEFPDGRIQVRHNGVALPCTIFDPHQQRVTHAAITDNKHLSAVLAHNKAEQDKVATTAGARRKRPQRLQEEWTPQHWLEHPRRPQAKRGPQSQPGLR